MEVSEDGVISIADAFQAAGLEGAGWHAALEQLAQATGSNTGELIGIGSDAAVPFNIMTNMDPGFHPAFVAGGGGDPRVNPYVAAGMSAPVLKVLADPDFMSADDYKRNPWYREFLTPWNVPHICLTTLERQEDMLIGLAVVRSRRNGHITASQRAVFTAIAPHVRAAVRTQIALNNQGARLLNAAFEGLEMIAFVCDRHGRVQAMTPAAEELVGEAKALSLRLGHLHAHSGRIDRALANAIDFAASGPAAPGKPRASTLVAPGTGPGGALVLDVVRLPDMAHDLMFNPRVLIAVRQVGATNRARVAMVARQAFGLTEAEADVAMRIAAGEAPDAIAAARGATVGTVRAQRKAVMAKLGVRRQAELVGRLAGL
ncbi:hypothetical protein GCM10023144_21590 [Pigmentiphaga soli]|uniref:HTH luxR-type domain-containing protein n=1 Tax=Pigmentiphaga soli TaxID=1007095 RepID=A0ABP8GZZ7_9BURK